MDEKTATQEAAEQIVNELGPSAGFMIALRILQVIAQRSGTASPELVTSFEGALRAMERFAHAAGISDPAPPPVN